MHSFQLTNRYMGVNLSGFQVRVPEHLLDETNVCAIIQHEGCHAVAKHVTGTALADFGGIYMAPGRLNDPSSTARLHLKETMCGHRV